MRVAQVRDLLSTLQSQSTKVLELDTEWMIHSIRRQAEATILGTEKVELVELINGQAP